MFVTTNHEASDVDAADVEVIGGVAILDDVVRDVEDVGAVRGSYLICRTGSGEKLRAV